LNIVWYLESGIDNILLEYFIVLSLLMILEDIDIGDDAVVESRPGSSSLNNLCVWGLGLWIGVDVTSINDDE
jgi:hypothetical protein